MRPSRRELSRYLRAAPGGAALPTFLTIGTPQAGTTWLYDNLRLHPDINIPWKEIRFWSRHPSAPVWLYARAFDRRAPVRGEITPHYGFLRTEVIYRIRRQLGNVRLLVVIRHPVFRAWSTARRRQCFDLDSVQCLMRSSPPPWLPGLDSARDSGNYSEMLRRWLSVFDRDSLHVVWFPDIIERQEETLRGVLRHIGCSHDRFPWNSLKLSRVNSNPTFDIPRDVYAFLSGWYRDQAALLTDVLGYEPLWD